MNKATTEAADAYAAAVRELEQASVDLTTAESQLKAATDRVKEAKAVHDATLESFQATAKG